MTVYVTRKWRIVQVSDGLGFPVWQCLIPIYVRWRVGDAGVGVEADFAGESLAEHYGSWEKLQ